MANVISCRLQPQFASNLSENIGEYSSWNCSDDWCDTVANTEKNLENYLLHNFDIEPVERVAKMAAKLPSMVPGAKYFFDYVDDADNENLKFDLIDTTSTISYDHDDNVQMTKFDLISDNSTLYFDQDHGDVFDLDEKNMISISNGENEVRNYIS